MKNLFFLLIGLLFTACNSISFTEEDVTKLFTEAVANPAYEKQLYGLDRLNWQPDAIEKICSSLAPTTDQKYKICHTAVLKNGDRMFMIEGENILYGYALKELKYNYGIPTAMQMKNGNWFPAICQKDAKLAGYRINTFSPYGDFIFMDELSSLEEAISEKGLEDNVDEILLPCLVNK